MMKKAIKVGSAFLVMAVLLAGSNGFVHNTQAAVETKQAAVDLKQAGTITVFGKGKIKAKPDIATVSLGVQTENADAKVAQTENNSKIKTVIDQLKALGIADADIQTSQYYMYPKYDYRTDENKIIGYTVNNSITVTIKNINKVGEIVDASVAAGANIAGGIQFSIADTTAYYEKALDSAISNAKSKGGSIAKSMGVTVGNPISVTEMDTYSMPVYETAMKQNDLAGGSNIMPVEVGELEVSATIEAVFQY